MMLKIIVFLVFISFKCNYSYKVYYNLKFRSNLIHYSDKDDIFGAEFNEINYNQLNPAPTWVADQDEEFRDYKGNIFHKITPEKRQKSMDGFEKARITFILDSIFVSILGFCAFWSFGTFKDATSYAIGTSLGTLYAFLLTRYVEGIGTDDRRSKLLGPLRFAPVVLIVLLYSKNKQTISFIPEFVGFFSFQISSFLQAFNDSLYGDEE